VDRGKLKRYQAFETCFAGLLRRMNAMPPTRATLEVGPAGSLSPVGTSVIRAFVGLSPFRLARTDVFRLRDHLGGTFHVRPDRDVEVGEYVELVVEECVSDERPMPEES